MADRDLVLTKEEIDAALEARHSRTVQERLRAGKVAVAGAWRPGLQCGRFPLQGLALGTCI